jgi:endonuclease/exonuclease/phosphatase family metal-dependent hydrolase
VSSMTRRRWLGLVSIGALLGALGLCGGGPQWLLGQLEPGSPWPPTQPTTTAQPQTSGTLRVLTFNVLCRACDKDGYEPWDERLGALRDVLERHDADLVGLQELVGHDDLAEIMGPASPYTVVSYELGPWVYADAALLVRDSRFEVLDSGQLWLSPHPGRPFSAGWQRITLPRYAAWAHLRQRNDGAELLFVNAHFDNNGPNKDGAAALFHQVFGATDRTLPAVVAGDFNTHRNADRYPTLLAGGALRNAQDLAAIVGLVGMPDPDARYFDTAELVDHVLVSDGVTVRSWAQDSPQYGENGDRPSDHPVIVVELELTRQ